jgi:hypothetical protein
MKLYNTSGVLPRVRALALCIPVFRLFDTKNGALRAVFPAHRYKEKTSRKIPVWQKSAKGRSISHKKYCILGKNFFLNAMHFVYLAPVEWLERVHILF